MITLKEEFPVISRIVTLLVFILVLSGCGETLTDTEYLARAKAYKDGTIVRAGQKMWQIPWADDGRLTLPAIKSHVPERVRYKCPICDSMWADKYADHKGLMVCAECGCTFDPSVES